MYCCMMHCEIKIWYLEEKDIWMKYSCNKFAFAAYRALTVANIYEESRQVRN